MSGNDGVGRGEVLPFYRVVDNRGGFGWGGLGGRFVVG